ncbi:MAG: hypothetical protein IJ711_09655, partial [Lachnospiraceae bacterium]|nr:hypothetical protein [Lachnospiraceae bacterium]
IQEWISTVEAADIPTPVSDNKTTPSIGDGTYYDDMDSQLVISHDDENRYYIDFGVHKVTYVEDAIGEYDTDSGILHFTGCDYDGKDVTAEIECRDEHLVVTITDWEYTDFLPNGTTLDFYQE